MRSSFSFVLCNIWSLLQFILAAYFTIASASAADRRNIVVILADDLGAGSISAVYGADLHETPRLDGLAKESVLFRQAYASAPVCSPTRAALMTGKHPARVGITIWAEGSIEGRRIGSCCRASRNTICRPRK